MSGAFIFFYPGQWQDLNENRLALPLTEEETAADTDPYEAAPSVEAAASGETLCADTEYVLEEADIVRGTTVETSWKIPHKYIGMNRENFLESMELYAAHPPLSEIERGFVGLEVLSFFPGKSNGPYGLPLCPAQRKFLSGGVGQ
ncbi:hypothetical protein [Waltera sp.]|uniref:hypothetical protein n=1 Tax=Waltera sp. TaxID=2815806 RepID=UPI00399F08FD